jgi:hypothetical protein
MHRKGLRMERMDFNGDPESRQQTMGDEIKGLLGGVAASTDKTELPERLDGFLRRLARMDKAGAEPYLGHMLKDCFGLSAKDIDAYRERVNNYRKELAVAEAGGDKGDGSRPVFAAVFDGLVDIVEHDGKPAFLIKDGDGLSIDFQAERDGVVYDPPPREQIPWLLPRGEEVLRHYYEGMGQSASAVDAALYDDLVSYHKAISEFPIAEYYDLIAAWDMHTYLSDLEGLQYSPIICLFAVPERGKSRTGKGMIYVARRGVVVESLREPYIVRMAEYWRASIFFDVMDIWKKAEKTGSIDILLHRYEKGATVPRIMYPEAGAFRDIVYYSTFGPTIIGTNVNPHKILETRAITINMPETGREFENDVRPGDALELKERLVAFRARHLGVALPYAKKPAKKRLGDILKPLLQIIRLVRPEREPAFKGLVKEIEGGRMMEKAESLEARILMNIVALVNEDQVQNGILSNRAITDAMNAETPEGFDPLTYARIGRKLSAMGFDKAKTGNGASAIIYDAAMMERLLGQYGLQQPSEPSEMPDTPVVCIDGTDGSDGSDGYDIMERSFVAPMAVSRQD